MRTFGETYKHTPTHSHQVTKNKKTQQESPDMYLNDNAGLFQDLLSNALFVLTTCVVET